MYLYLQYGDSQHNMNQYDNMTQYTYVLGSNTHYKDSLLKVG